MAELLIKNISVSYSDPDKDKRGCYKKGDIVVVMPDGHNWGTEELSEKFFILKIPGIAVNRIEGYCMPEFDEDDQVITRRRHKIPLDTLSQQQIDELGNKNISTTNRMNLFKQIEIDKTE